MMAGRTFDLQHEVPRIGLRAELLASWYFRFNGYFPISGFIVHDAGVEKQPGGQITEADILAIRLPNTEEVIKAPDALIRDEEFLKYCLRRFGRWAPKGIPTLARKLSVRKSIGPTKGVRVQLLSLGATRANGLAGIKQITFEHVLTYMAKPLFGCYNDQLGVVGGLIVSDHQQWHPLIFEVYKRLRGHKVKQQSPTEVADWLFPPVTDPH